MTLVSAFICREKELQSSFLSNCLKLWSWLLFSCKTHCSSSQGKRGALNGFFFQTLSSLSAFLNFWCLTEWIKPVFSGIRYVYSAICRQSFFRRSFVAFSLFKLLIFNSPFILDIRCVYSAGSVILIYSKSLWYLLGITTTQYKESILPILWTRKETDMVKVLVIFSRWRNVCYNWHLSASLCNIWKPQISLK